MNFKNSVCGGDLMPIFNTIKEYTDFEDEIYEINDSNFDSIRSNFVKMSHKFNHEIMANLLINVAKARRFSYLHLIKLWRLLNVPKHNFRRTLFTRLLYFHNLVEIRGDPLSPILASPSAMYPPNSIEHAIFMDDIDAFLLATSTIFKKDLEIQCFIEDEIKEKVKAIDFAAFCNSPNIFKFLELNGSEITFKSSEYAIKSGSEEILEYIINSSHSYCLFPSYIAIQYHRNNIFKWLCDLDSSSLVSSLDPTNVIQYGNTKYFMFLFQNKTVNTPLDQLIITAIHAGNLVLLRLFLSIADRKTLENNLNYFKIIIHGYQNYPMYKLFWEFYSLYTDIKIPEFQINEFTAREYIYLYL